METVTRASLTEAVWREMGLSREDSERFVEDVIETLKERLAAGDAVKIARFGSFFVRDKGMRKARNPKTGEPAVVSARRVVAFRPSRKLREGVDGHLSGGVAPPAGPGRRSRLP